MSEKLAKFCFVLVFLWSFIKGISAKDPLDFLINKFEKKIDTNIYYMSSYERQRNDKFFCLSSDGPYCSFINERLLGSTIKKPLYF